MTILVLGFGCATPPTYEARSINVKLTALMSIEAVSTLDRDLLRPLRYLWRVPLLLVHVLLGILLCGFILTWNRHGVMKNGREPFTHRMIRAWSTGLMRIFGL